MRDDAHQPAALARLHQRLYRLVERLVDRLLVQAAEAFVSMRYGCFAAICLGAADVDYWRNSGAIHAPTDFIIEGKHRMGVTLIGIDCATQDVNTGVALADYDDGVIVLREVMVGSHDRPAVSIVSSWLRSSDGPMLLALDAPLGWPAPLAPALIGHRAGSRIDTPMDALFQRKTDHFVQKTQGKKPLDVGADRIARTAHAALRILGELGDRLGMPIPLLWALPFDGVGAIEVYPAATLIAHRCRSEGYKKAEQANAREEILSTLRTLMDLACDDSLLKADADALDAAVCVLAAADFLQGRAVPPADRSLAEREGWIWVPPSQCGSRS